MLFLVQMFFLSEKFEALRSPQSVSTAPGRAWTTLNSLLFPSTAAEGSLTASQRWPVAVGRRRRPAAALGAVDAAQHRPGDRGDHP